MVTTATERGCDPAVEVRMRSLLLAFALLVAADTRAQTSTPEELVRQVTAEVLEAIKSDPHLAEVPVMLVTNYPEHQALAVAAGAVPGFGKNALNSPQTRECLAPYCS